MMTYPANIHFGTGAMIGAPHIVHMLLPAQERQGRGGAPCEYC